MPVKTVRQWEYKGMMLEVKHINLFSDFSDIDGLHTDLTNGHHCGYVTISHRALGENEVNSLEVHGGITFQEEHAHLNRYTYGFDCAHYNDTIAHWDAERVSQECQDLAN